MNTREVSPVSAELLREVAGYEDGFQGAYNIRQDSGCAGRRSTKNIQIVPHREGKPGIEIHVARNTPGEVVHLPATVTKSGVHDVTYNDFYIAENARVTIVAGCGVHTDQEGDAGHNGIHRFFIEKDAQVLYQEKHVGQGPGTGKRRIDPVTEIFLAEGAKMTIETTQLDGVDVTDRVTRAILQAGAKLVVRERLLTTGRQQAFTRFDVTLEGGDSGCDLVSRSVAREQSRQQFYSRIVGKGVCHGHSACDAILAEDAVVMAAPQLDAFSPEAALIHEAAIGKIAGEQILKLRTLGLTEEEAEAKIIEGFLR